MHTYNPNIHNRRSIRLKGYDYSQAGLYFITICCQDRAHLFGNIENGEMKLNAFGKIAWEEWLATEKIRKNCKIHESIVMLNHIHGIIEILYKKEKSSEGESQFAPAIPSDIGKFKSPSQTIGAIIRGFKIATIKKIKDYIQENKEDLEKFNIEDIPSGGELQFAPKESSQEDSAPKDSSPDDSASKESDIEKSEKREMGELQFAPTTEKIINLNFKIWQRNYYEHIIRNEQAYYRIANYIINNPKNWKEDKFHK